MLITLAPSDGARRARCFRPWLLISLALACLCGWLSAPARSEAFQRPARWTLTNFTGVMAFSSASNCLAVAQQDNSIVLLDAADGALLHTLTGHTGAVTAVAISPDGQTVAAAGNDNTIKCWRTGDGTLLQTLLWANAITSLAFSPDGQTLVSGTLTDNVSLWRVSTGTVLRTLTGHMGYVTAVAFSPDGLTVASGSADDTIKLWQVSDGTLLNTLTGHTSGVNAVAFSPDGLTLASGSASPEHAIKLWRISDGTLLRTLSGHTADVLALAFTPDSRTLASGSADDTVKLWQVSNGTLSRTLSGSTGGISFVGFSADGLTLAAGGANSPVALWRVSDGTLLYTFTGYGYLVPSVAVSPDGTMIAAACGDKTIKLWQASNGALLRTLTGHTAAVTSVAFSPDGTMLVSGGDDNAVLLWRASDGTLLRSIVGHTAPVYAVAFSPDGATVASGSGDQSIDLWRVNDGMMLQHLTGHTGSVNAVAFSPDGATLASGSTDHTLKLWRVSDGTPLQTLSGHSSGVNAVAYSPDGKTLASGSADATIKLWQVSNDTLLRTLTGHIGGVNAVAFSPDGASLASGGADATSKLWRVSNGAVTDSTVAGVNGVFSVAYAPDGASLAVSGAGGLTLWGVNNSATPFTITPTAGANGGISPNTAQAVAYGNSITFTAAAHAGYLVNSWTLDGALYQSGSASCTLTNITANHALNVTFIAVSTTWHPADTNTDGRIGIGEATAYGAAWQRNASWPAGPSPIPMDYVTNAGYLWKSGEIYYFDGTQTPPNCWAAGAVKMRLRAAPATAGCRICRQLADHAAAGAPVTIQVTVTPSTGVACYAVQEIPPAGWRVTGISDGGQTQGGLVKWGPFFDHTIRALRYTVLPDDRAAGRYTVAGAASFDGHSLGTAAQTITIGTLRQPDLAIRPVSAADYTGAGVISRDGAGQTVRLSVPAGVAATYLVRVQNAGTAADTFILTAPVGASGWVVSYHDLATMGDITPRIVNGGWRTPRLAPGACASLWVQVAPTTRVKSGAGNSLRITATSLADNTRQDAVQAVTSKE